MACSRCDSEILEALCPGRPMHIVPNVINVDEYIPRPEPAGETVLFFGSMDWHPNEDAVIYFGESILPLIRQQIPHASFAVVGRNPTQRLRDAAGRLGMIITDSPNRRSL